MSERMSDATSTSRSCGPTLRTVAFMPVLLASLAAAQTPGHYTGLAEASAAAALDAEHMVVAEDECNTLLVYKFGQPSPVGKPIELDLGTGGKASDLEGAARVGDLIYWISSHSQTKSGKANEWRHRFFATRVDRSTSPPTVTPFGKPHAGLMKAAADDKNLAGLNLADAAAKLPEEPGGLNIEGLAAWGNDGLLIGFRSPLRSGDKAVLVPLENPSAVLAGEAPRFAPPLLLDLDKRGIRSIDRVGDHYVIVAGPTANVGSFDLYRWSGNANDKPVLLPGSLPAGHAFEALVAIPGTRDRKLVLLSDDGVDDGIKCGKSGKAAQKFRSMHLELK